MNENRSTRHVLLCDDELPILRAAEFKLRRGGFDVECADDGQAAWEAIQRRRPDLLITDYQMPRLDGFALIQRIRDTEGLADLPIIMLTAKGLELPGDDVVERWKLVALVSKPFSPRELLHLVETTLLEQGALLG